MWMKCAWLRSSTVVMTKTEERWQDFHRCVVNPLLSYLWPSVIIINYIFEISIKILDVHNFA